MAEVLGARTVVTVRVQPGDDKGAVGLGSRHRMVAWGCGVLAGEERPRQWVQAGKNHYGAARWYPCAVGLAASLALPLKDTAEFHCCH